MNLRSRVIAVAVLAASLAACSGDPIAGPGALAPRAVLVGTVETDLIRATYLCHNSFQLSNGNAQAVTVDWRLNGTTTATTVTIPANGTLRVDAPFQQTFVLFYAGRQIAETTNPGGAACPVDGNGGNGGGPVVIVPKVDVTYVCRNVFRIDNPGDASVTFDWVLNTTSVRGVVTVPAHGSAFVIPPSQQALVLFYQGTQAAEEANPGITSCPADGLVDIAPNEKQPNVNIKGNGALMTVAILSNAWFDATTLDVSTVTIGGVHLNRLSSGSYQHWLGDANEDGRKDIIVVFKIQDLVRAGLVTPNTTSLTVSWLWNGATMAGSDAIRVVNR